MNAREKTKVLGFRSYSKREQKERERAMTDRASTLTVYMLQRLLAQEGVRVSRDLSDQEKDKFYTTPINETYDYAYNNGYSLYDLESVMRGIQDFATHLERMANFANGEMWKLSFAMTGENKFEYVPLKKISDLTTALKETFKHEDEAPEESDEPEATPIEETQIQPAV